MIVWWFLYIKQFSAILNTIISNRIPKISIQSDTLSHITLVCRGFRTSKYGAIKSFTAAGTKKKLPPQLFIIATLCRLKPIVKPHIQITRTYIEFGFVAHTVHQIPTK